LVGRYEGNKLLGRYCSRRDDSFKMDLDAVGSEDLN
jgi:hypothetical protein